MKKVLLIILSAAFCMCTTSCEKWLEATSSTKIPADRLFESRGGFCDALTGVYITLGDNAMYGQSMSYLFADLIAYPYNYSPTNTVRYIQQHNYASAAGKSRIQAIWSKAYNAVANINLALEALESRSDVLYGESEYALFKGELLGLRAYIHLDLIRLFGIPDTGGDNAGKLTVPYVTGFDREPTAQRSYAETFKMLFSDLDESIRLLEAYDPVAGNISDEDLLSINQDGFWTHRSLRFNYYAALALKARALMYTGEYGQAAEFAGKAVDGSLESGFTSWSNPDELVSDIYAGSCDYTSSSEHLFSLQVTELQKNFSIEIVSNSLFGGYCLPSYFVDNTLFPRYSPETGSFAGTEDVRGPLSILSHTSFGYTPKKLLSMEGSKGYNLMPMLKLSEMYYIMAENQIAQGNNAEALSLLDEVRSHRGITDNLTASCDAASELMLEYYREFINEGQLVYYLKHKQVQSSAYPGFALTADELVLPYPDEEIKYGRVQEL